MRFVIRSVKTALSAVLLGSRVMYSTAWLVFGAFVVACLIVFVGDPQPRRKTQSQPERTKVEPEISPEIEEYLRRRLEGKEE